MAVSTVPANILYIGTNSREVYRVDTANVGTHILKDITCKSGYDVFPPGAYVTCIAVDPQNANNVIVAYSNYGVRNLFRSINGGKTWARIGGNLDATDGPSVRWATIQHLPTGGTIYWVAASTGLYATDTLQDSVTVWVQQGANTIGNSVCDMVDVRQSDGLVAIATHTRGVYTANITSVTQIATVHNISPQTLSLQAEVYPNPSSGKSTLSYYLPNEGNVQLRIYDQGGKVVQQMQLNNAHKGDNISEIDLSKQAAGIYFCSLVTADEVKTLKLLLVK